MNGTAKQAAVLRACEVAGGMDALGSRLGISRLGLAAMASGRIEVPQRIFFELIDIIGMQSAPDPARPRPASGAAEQPGD